MPRKRKPDPHYSERLDETLAWLQDAAEKFLRRASGVEGAPSFHRLREHYKVALRHVRGLRRALDRADAKRAGYYGLFGGLADDAPDEQRRIIRSAKASKAGKRGGRPRKIEEDEIAGLMADYIELKKKPGLSEQSVRARAGRRLRGRREAALLRELAATKDPREKVRLDDEIAKLSMPSARVVAAALGLSKKSRRKP